MSRRFSLFFTLVSLFVLPAARAEILGYYVGVDTQAVIPTGTYAGQANPHHNKLVLLFSHPSESSPSSSHYHRKAFLTYTGPAATPTTVQNGPSNLPSQLPENLVPLPLQGGSGIYAGKLRTSFDTSNEYSLNTLAPTAHLTTQSEYSNTTSPEYYLYNSSAGRYNGSLGDTSVFLQLVSISSGLNIGTSTNLSAGFSGAGSSILLGTGNTWASTFDPVFWTDSSTPAGTPLSATFRLVAGGTNTATLGNSAEFTFNTTAVPEPGTYAFVGCAIGAVCFWKIRRRRLAAIA